MIIISSIAENCISIRTPQIEISVKKYLAHLRHYGLLGNFDSVEATVYAYDNDSGPFSKAGDSGAGALIAGPEAGLIALLTTGTSQTDSSDITYGTPMYWLWNDVIKPQFPGANLYFDLPLN